MKTLVVTGASGDLGTAITEHAVAAGFRVAAMDVKADGIEALANRLDNVQAITVDVTDEASVKAAFDAIGAAPDVLVNNAGLVRFAPLLEHSIQDFRDVVEVNLVGAFIVAQEAARRMVQKGGGAIVNMTSIGGVHPAPSGGAYGATKAGLNMLTQLMSVEWGPQNIRVNAVAPGFIDAGMSAPFFKDPEVRKVRGSGVPLRRLGSADDVAKTVMFFATDQSAYISGQQITVDGGVINAVLAALPREIPKAKE